MNNNYSYKLQLQLQARKESTCEQLQHRNCYTNKQQLQAVSHNYDCNYHDNCNTAIAPSTTTASNHNYGNNLRLQP